MRNRAGGGRLGPLASWRQGGAPARRLGVMLRYMLCGRWMDAWVQTKIVQAASGGPAAPGCTSAARVAAAAAGRRK